MKEWWDQLTIHDPAVFHLVFWGVVFVIFAICLVMALNSILKDMERDEF